MITEGGGAGAGGRGRGRRGGADLCGPAGRGRPRDARAGPRPATRATSAVAAALWYPYRALPQDLVTRWSARTYRVLDELAADPATGVRMRDGVELLGPTAPAEPWWRAAVPVWRRCRPGARLPARLAPAPPGGRDGRLPRLPRPPARGRRRHPDPALARRAAVEPASWSTRPGSPRGRMAQRHRGAPGARPGRPGGPGRRRGVAARVLRRDPAAVRRPARARRRRRAAPPTSTPGTCAPIRRSPGPCSTGRWHWCRPCAKPRCSATGWGSGRPAPPYAWRPCRTRTASPAVSCTATATAVRA